MCTVCGRGTHADWCAAVRRAMREADEGQEPRSTWPWWLAPSALQDRYQHFAEQE